MDMYTINGGSTLLLIVAVVSREIAARVRVVFV